MSYESFRKSRMNFNERVLKAKQSEKNYGDGYDYWKLDVDKNVGHASAVIRFLPPKEEGDLPYAKIYSHFFRGDDGKWVIVDRCPTTYGADCPICAENSTLWQSGESDKARRRKRHINYIFNVYVIKDNNNPDNNGKVFLFKTGPTIFEMITSEMASQFGESPKRPFDLYGGHNFNLRVRLDPARNNLANYDKSSFDDKESDIPVDEDGLKKVYDSMVNLKEYFEAGREKVKEVQERYSKERHESNAPVVKRKTNTEIMDDLPWDDKEVETNTPTNEDDTLAYFKKLAEEA